jgi:hypothetical protein
MLILLCFSNVLRHMSQTMKINLLILAPVAMLALAACNKTETSKTDAAAAAAPAAPIELPPSITASGVFRCGDNTILYVDFLGANVAADIRVGDKTAVATRVIAPKADPVDPAAPAATAAAAPAKPEGPMKSADGETSLSGSGKSINVKLAGKGAQTCKG